MEDEITWGYADVVRLDGERSRRVLEPLRDVERWAEGAAERLSATATASARRESAGRLARVEGRQSAYADLAARMAAYQRLVPLPALAAVLGAERGWCEVEAHAARMAAEVSEGEERFHALGRAEALSRAASRFGAVLEVGRSVSPPPPSPSVLARRS